MEHAFARRMVLTLVAALGCGTDYDAPAGPNLREAIDPGEGGGGTVPACIINEGDLGTDVEFLGTSNPCNEGAVAFNGAVDTIRLRYDPTFTAGSPPFFSAVVVLNYATASDYVAHFVGAETFSSGKVTHTIPIVPSVGQAGIRIRSFVGTCPAGITDPLTCWANAEASHDELHVCIDNQETVEWEDPEVFCAAGLGGEAEYLPVVANWSYTASTPIGWADIAYYDFDASPSNGLQPLSYYWDNWNAPNSTCTAPWVFQHAGSVYAQGASGLLWSVRVRVRVVDPWGRADTVMMQLAGSC
ncbi:MAG TPA: hypothetical protein VGA37_02705 [Gemmatimonadales bacterium]